MKPSDAELVASLRREAAADRVVAPASFDFAVMRAVRDTPPALVAFPDRRRERLNALSVTATAACLALGALFGARTLGSRLDGLHAAGGSLAEMAQGAARFARNVRPPAFPEVPRLSPLS